MGSSVTRNEEGAFCVVSGAEGNKCTVRFFFFFGGGGGSWAAEGGMGRREDFGREAEDTAPYVIITLQCATRILAKLRFSLRDSK